jgi:hypothetical protein
MELGGSGIADWVAHAQNHIRSNATGAAGEQQQQHSSKGNLHQQFNFGVDGSSGCCSSNLIVAAADGLMLCVTVTSRCDGRQQSVMFCKHGPAAAPACLASLHLC